MRLKNIIIYFFFFSTQAKTRSQILAEKSKPSNIQGIYTRTRNQRALAQQKKDSSLRLAANISLDEIRPKKIISRRKTVSATRDQCQPNRLSTRRVTLSDETKQSGRLVVHGEKNSSLRLSAITSHDESRPKKINTRRKTVSVARDQSQPKRLSTRRVTFSEETTIHRNEANQQPVVNCKFFFCFGDLYLLRLTNVD